MKKALLIVILFSFLLAGCNTYCPEEETAAGIESINDLAGDWDDAFTLANSTPRIQLSNRIADLQSVQSEVDDLEVPECLIPTRYYLSRFMDTSIDGFIAFMEQESDTYVSATFDIASSEMQMFFDEFDRVQDCYPRCDRNDAPTVIN